MLKGDRVSPLLFSMVFKIFFQTLTKCDLLMQMNCVYHKIFSPTTQLEFPDVIVALTFNEYKNQILLNIFTRWCRQSIMIIRSDKCSSFGKRKHGSKSFQLQPNLFINSEVINAVELCESTQCLGSWFNFEMDNQKHKKLVIKISSLVLNEIDRLPLHSKNTILLYSRYLLSKLSWHLTIADIEPTWIINPRQYLPYVHLTLA